MKYCSMLGLSLVLMACGSVPSSSSPEAAGQGEVSVYLNTIGQHGDEARRDVQGCLQVASDSGAATPYARRMAVRSCLYQQGHKLLD